MSKNGRQYLLINAEVDRYDDVDYTIVGHYDSLQAVYMKLRENNAKIMYSSFVITPDMELLEWKPIQYRVFADWLKTSLYEQTNGMGNLARETLESFKAIGENGITEHGKDILFAVKHKQENRL